SPVFGFTATTDGVSRLPSEFSRTAGSPASIIATTEFVVPRSIPSTFGMLVFISFLARCSHRSHHRRPSSLVLALSGVHPRAQRLRSDCGGSGVVTIRPGRLVSGQSDV